VRDQVSQPYKTTGKIMFFVFHIRLSFLFLYHTMEPIFLRSSYRLSPI
jgi:hypothetical protein